MLCKAYATNYLKDPNTQHAIDGGNSSTSQIYDYNNKYFDSKLEQACGMTNMYHLENIHQITGIRKIGGLVMYVYIFLYFF